MKWKRWGKAKRLSRADATAMVEQHRDKSWVVSGDTLVAIGDRGQVYRCLVLDVGELPPRTTRKKARRRVRP